MNRAASAYLLYIIFMKGKMKLEKERKDSERNVVGSDETYNKSFINRNKRLILNISQEVKDSERNVVGPDEIYNKSLLIVINDLF